MKTGMFQDAFNEHGITVVEVSENIQNLIHDSVFSFRAEGLNKKNKGMMEEAAAFLVKNGAQAIIMGCTEIPLILEKQKVNVKLINPNAIIADIAVKYAKNKIQVVQVGDKYLSVNGRY